MRGMNFVPSETGDSRAGGEGGAGADSRDGGSGRLPPLSVIGPLSQSAAQQERKRPPPRSVTLPPPRWSDRIIPFHRCCRGEGCGGAITERGISGRGSASRDEPHADPRCEGGRNPRCEGGRTLSGVAAAAPISVRNSVLSESASSWLTTPLPPTSVDWLSLADLIPLHIALCTHSATPMPSAASGSTGLTNSTGPSAAKSSPRSLVGSSPPAHGCPPDRLISEGLHGPAGAPLIPDAGDDMAKRVAVARLNGDGGRSSCIGPPVSMQSKSSPLTTTPQMINASPDPISTNWWWDM